MSDKQGTPVQIRDGPAAVTECHFRETDSSHCRTSARSAKSEPPNDEKASFSKLGSQKTYQRVFRVVLREGRRLRKFVLA
jgi:hypothetical protein